MYLHHIVYVYMHSSVIYIHHILFIMLLLWSKPISYIGLFKSIWSSSDLLSNNSLLGNRDPVVECSILLETEGRRVRTSPASLCCFLEQDTLILRSNGWHSGLKNFKPGKNLEFFMLRILRPEMPSW